MSDTPSGAYVIDEDYTIVSFNDTITGLYPQLEVGEKCHRCLMGLDEPCPPCPVANHVFGPRTDDELHKLLEQKHYDSVTGGYSRQGFIREVERVFAEGDRSAYAVVVSDIFNFKAINDALGVEGGDEALSIVFDALKDSSNPRAVSQQLGEGRLQGLLPAHRARRRRGGLLGGGARALGAPDDGDHRPPRGGRSCPCSNGTIRYRCSTATSCARCTRSKSRSCNGASLVPISMNLSRQDFYNDRLMNEISSTWST